MIAGKGKNTMKNTSAVASNTRLQRWIPGVWVGSIQFFVSIVAIVLGLSVPITATAAGGKVLLSGTYLQVVSTGKFDLRHSVVTLTDAGKKSKDWTGGAAPQWKQRAMDDGNKWTSKWSKMEGELNTWWSDVATKGLEKKEWVAQAKAIKAKYGDDGLKEFITLFASKETTGDTGKFTKALWKIGNDKSPGMPLDLSYLLN
jgi:hypothetical protein